MTNKEKFNVLFEKEDNVYYDERNYNQYTSNFNNLKREFNKMYNLSDKVDFIDFVKKIIL